MREGDFGVLLGLIFCKPDVIEVSRTGMLRFYMHGFQAAPHLTEDVAGRFEFREAFLKSFQDFRQ